MNVLEKIVENENIYEPKRFAQPLFQEISLSHENLIEAKIINLRRRYKIVDEDLKTVIQNNNVEQLKTMYEEGYNIYANNDYLLKLASYHGYTKIVNFLIEKGCNPDTNNEVIENRTMFPEKNNKIKHKK